MTIQIISRGVDAFYAMIYLVAFSIAGAIRKIKPPLVDFTSTGDVTLLLKKKMFLDWRESPKPRNYPISNIFANPIDRFQFCDIRCVLSPQNCSLGCAYKFSRYRQYRVFWVCNFARNWVFGSTILSKMVFCGCTICLENWVFGCTISLEIGFLGVQFLSNLSFWVRYKNSSWEPDKY